MLQRADISRDRSGSRPSDAKPVLQFDAVSHAYRGSGTIVDSLDFTLYEGETLCLLGPSGCGKSTTLRLAAGLEQPSHGQILLDGVVVATGAGLVPAEERDIGLVFQDYALFPHLTVAGNIAFGINTLPGKEQKQRIKEVLDLVGLADRGNAMPHELSGGQQQRVALARALVRKPRLLLLDEPFSGLDARLRDEIRDQTLHILKESGIASLLVTHDAEEAMFMADQILVLRQGQTEQWGTPDDLYFKPASAFIAEFFGEVNSLPGIVVNGKVDTIFGAIPAPDLAEGARAMIVIRPEALRLAEPTSRDFGCQAKVMTSRLLGRTSLVHMTAERAGYDSQHLHVRYPGRFLPGGGFDQPVTLDMQQVFVFAD